MAYADNPPFKAWRIKVRSEGVLFYIVSSTEPFERPDGSIAYTEVPGYGEHIARIDWATAGPISWWVLDPEKDKRRAPAKVDAAPKVKREKKAKNDPPEPEHKAIPAAIAEDVRALALTQFSDPESVGYRQAVNRILRNWHATGRVTL